MANSSSLSNVVSGLVRAQMGSSIPKSTLDEELDKRVAELILKEARQKEAKYGRTGSYSPQTSGNAVKTNKRFLTSIIKSTDEHNKTILRAQSESANEVKQQREREEREERMRRAQEAVAARIGSSSGSWRLMSDRNHRGRSVSEERYERHRSSRPDRRERSPHSDAGSNQEERRTKRRRREDRQEDRRSASPPRRRVRNGNGAADHDEYRHSSRNSSNKPRDEDDRRRHRRRSRSCSPRRDEDRSTRWKPRRDDSLNVEEETRTRRDKGSKRRWSRSPRDKSKLLEAGNLSSAEAGPSPRPEGSTEEESFIGPQPVSPEHAPTGVPSKMDKYFAKDYDPRLDVAPAMSALSAKDGLIPPGAFDNWDMMLEIVRVRREEKEERKRLEKLHRSGISSSKKKTVASVVVPRTDAEELLSMQYTKRGGVREWDEGKKETT